MNKVVISNYGRYSSSNYGVNTIRVDIGSLTLWFSYKTVVAFQIDGRLKRVSKNAWGPTTGKHLNWIDGGDKSSRLSRETFEHELEMALGQYGLLTSPVMVW